MTKNMQEMTKSQLDEIARKRNLPGRSKMTRGVMAHALIQQELNTRIGRFGTFEKLTPKQRRRVTQKMNRQKPATV